MNPLVPTSWLAGRLADPRTVILDATLPPVGIAPPVDTFARYVASHISGAIFFDIEALSDRSTSLPHMMPTAEAFSLDMSALGIDDRMAICIYEQEGVFSAPRAWWMLRTFGARGLHPRWRPPCLDRGRSSHIVWPRSPHAGQFPRHTRQ
jgi:thiosulfate/3-mercaptopyruvate sulfurtransferase